VNVGYGALWIPTVNIYNTSGVLLSQKTGNDVSHSNDEGTIDHDIEWGNGELKIKLNGAGDFGSKSKVTVVLSW
jgi:hypothetical protein